MLEFIKTKLEERKESKKSQKKDELSFGRIFMLGLCDLKELSDEINNLTEELEEEN